MIVTFRCEGVDSCPAPVTVRDDGRDWLVTRSIVDRNGAEANVAVAINIDTTAPKVVITSPMNDTTTQQTRVSVTASATDFGSGLHSATCNGRPATLHNGNISCVVPLHEGLNGVIVQAMDAAGNSGSTGIHVVRPAVNPALTIVPGTATLIRGEQRAVQLVDVAGHSLSGAQWSVSNPLIAALEGTADGVVVRGLGPGTVTIRARRGQATAEAQFTVSLKAQLPYGAVRWSMLPVPGFGGTEPIYTHHTVGGPDVFTLERESNGPRILLKAATTTPTVLWIESPGMSDDEQVFDKMGESFGGVLLLVGRSGGAPTAIVRAGRPTHGPLWRYESSGSLADDFAQGWDGTVYVIESGRDRFPQLLVLDGASGYVKYRWPIPRSLRAVPGSCGALQGQETPAVVSNPTVPDGEVGAFSFLTVHESSCATAGTATQMLHLVRAAPSAEIDVKALHVREHTTTSMIPSIQLPGVIPHYLTAVLVPWKVTGANGVIENHVTRLEGELKTDYTLPFMSELGIGDDTAYTLSPDERSVVNFDPATGRVRWVRHVTTGKIRVSMVTSDGGIAMQYQGALLDENYRPLPHAPVSPNPVAVIR